MSDLKFERALRDWLEDGSDRTPRPAIDAVLLAVKTTPQERDLRIPWRFFQMPALSRVTGVAAVALVAAVSVGGLLYLNAKGPGGPGISVPPSATAAPTGAPTAGPTSDSSTSPATLPPASVWTEYTSDVHGFTIAYPPGWRLESEATRAWDPALDVPLRGNASPYAEIFVNEQGSVAFSVWRVPADIQAIENSRSALIAWVEEFCDSMTYYKPCSGIAERAVPMCRERADCHSDAVIVPFDDDVLAFFVGADDALTLAQVWWGDSAPEVAPYGGSIRLLQAFLEPMNVTVPGPGQGE